MASRTRGAAGRREVPAAGGSHGSGVRLPLGHSELTVDFDLDGDTPRLIRLARPGDGDVKGAAGAALPLVDVTLFGDGTGWSGPRFTGTALGARLRHRAHHATYGDGWHHLRVELCDPAGRLAVFVDYSSPDGVPVLRSRVRLRNDSKAPVTVRSVSSLLLGALPSPDVLDVHRARNDWLAECRWYGEALRESVPDVGREFHGHDGRAGLRLAARGSWPADGHLPMGAFTDRTDGRCLLWQIESAASRLWETGEADRHTCLALSGPTADGHQWRQILAPGEEFASEYAALALGDGFDGALAALTSYRRLMRRPHPDHERLPVVFNDYMNTLNGRPARRRAGRGLPQARLQHHHVGTRAPRPLARLARLALVRPGPPPPLVLENCASGGLRMDGASLAATQVQSTSDQQDLLRYPPIAAAAPTAVPPEQGAVWAYPQPDFTDAEIAFTLGSALLGRVHLSGHLDRMTPGQLALVRDAMATYKSIRADLRTALPFWPLGAAGVAPAPKRAAPCERR